MNKKHAITICAYSNCAHLLIHCYSSSL